MSGFLIRSLVLSAVLTILLNVFLVWRGRGIVDNLLDQQRPSRPEQPTPNPSDAADERPRIQVFVPWKAMVIGSIVLTVTLNLVAWLAR